MIGFQGRHSLPAAGTGLSPIKKITSMRPKEQATRPERMKTAADRLWGIFKHHCLLV
ncbi:hypothetical protein [Nitrosomonas sp. HPC101]|uniref:hypothetical protein n=1 Tax=Nitrosomonas sp. HPC101 TaxID=1658667 RepID=UPI00136EA5CC|nr:hypothetical protein [Nitrosomonas sp. HPC101]